MHKFFSMHLCIYVEKDLCITLVIYQESLNDARSTKYKILTPGMFTEIV